MMPWSDPKHPIWPCIRLLVTMGGVTLMLWVTASVFDSTELKAIGGSGLFAFLAQFVRPGSKDT